MQLLCIVSIETMNDVFTILACQFQLEYFNYSKYESFGVGQNMTFTSGTSKIDFYTLGLAFIVEGELGRTGNIMD